MTPPSDVAWCCSAGWVGSSCSSVTLLRTVVLRTGRKATPYFVAVLSLEQNVRSVSPLCGSVFEYYSTFGSIPRACSATAFRPAVGLL